MNMFLYDSFEHGNYLLHNIPNVGTLVALHSRPITCFNSVIHIHGFWDPTGITLALVKTQGINCTDVPEKVPSKSLIRLRICSCFPIDVMPNSLRHEQSIIFSATPEISCSI